MPPFSVIIFNVGQGDHILLEFPNGEYAFIDFHHKYFKEPPGLLYLKKKMESSKNIKLNFLSISHNDEDHIKGLGQVLEFVRQNKKVKVDKIWLSGAPDPDQEKRALKEMFENFVPKTKKERLLINSIETFKGRLKQLDDFLKMQKKKFASVEFLTGVSSLGEIVLNTEKKTSLNCFCMAPLQNEVRKFYTKTRREIVLSIVEYKKITEKTKLDRNTMSSILLLKNTFFSVLFGGDSNRSTWNKSIKEWDNNYKKYFGEYSSDLIKASHHGAKSSSSIYIQNSIIKKKKKQHAHIVFSASINNQYNHPHEETIEDINHVSDLGFKIAMHCTSWKQSKGIETETTKDEYIDISPSLSERDKKVREDETAYGFETKTPPHFLGFRFSFTEKNKNSNEELGVQFNRIYAGIPPSE